MKKRALISVSDKSGVIEFGKGLESLGYEIISTGGTYETLKKNGVKVIAVNEVTGFDECLDGRVKTLHPKVHAGILALRNNKEHMSALNELDINTIDIVAVNLYPFKQTISKENVDFAEAVENIDIGGPTMIRSAAKNYAYVMSVCDPSDYNEVVARLKDNTVDDDFRIRLMYKAYRHTAVYDTVIADYLQAKAGIAHDDNLSMAYDKVQGLRYGENPHQSQAAFYRDCMSVGLSLADAQQLHGKELSYNNINDTSAAVMLVSEFDEPAVVALKHANPCGVAVSGSLSDAFCKAHDADPVSIFGGIIACNREVDAATAGQISKVFIEIVIAPSFSDEAMAILTRKQNIRLLKLERLGVVKPAAAKDYKRVLGGVLIQDSDTQSGGYDLQYVTDKKPDEKQLKDLLFAFKVVKHCKSNAILIAKDGVAIGAGIGQTNRIWAVNQAIEHAGDRVKGAVLASDAFFPFGDSVESAAAAGISAIIQPGGSNRDNDSIDACNRNGIGMVFTGVRHFKH